MNRLLLIPLGLLGIASSAFAHTGVLPVAGMLDGFLHPFLGLDHTLVMLGVGLWAAGQQLAKAGQVIALFLLYMLSGALLGLHGVEFAFVETAILLSLIAIGALLCVGRLSIPAAVAAIVIATSAVLHGLAHGSEIPATADAYSYLLGMLLATGMLHGLGFGLAKLLKPSNAGYWLRCYGGATGLVGAWLLFA